MSIKTTPRASATVLVPSVPAPVTLVPYAPETAPKPHGKKAGAVPEQHVEQAVVDAFLTAESGVKEAAVALFIACVSFSVSPAQFGARGDAKIRASEFNAAHHVGQLLGRDVAKEIITQAATHVGDKRANVLAMLRKAREFGKTIKGASLKGAALTKALKKAADDTLKAAKDAANFEKTTAKRGAQAGRIPKGDSLAAYAPIALAALGDMIEKLGKLNLKPAQLRKAKELGEALTEAADILDAMVRTEK